MRMLFSAVVVRVSALAHSAENYELTPLRRTALYVHLTTKLVCSWSWSCSQSLIYHHQSPLRQLQHLLYYDGAEVQANQETSAMTESSIIELRQIATEIINKARTVPTIRYPHFISPE